MGTAAQRIGRWAKVPGGESGALAPSLRNCLLTLLDATPGVVMVSTRCGKLLHMNGMGRRVLGVAPDAELGSWTAADVYAPRSYERLICEAIPTCVATGSWRGEITLIDSCGDAVPVSQVLLAHRDSVDAAPVIASMAWDIREYKDTEERLQHQATHDELTGLPNRTLLLDRLAKALDTAARHRRCVGLLFIDLDGFKAINDEFGHEAANAVLRDFSRRLRDAVRAEDTVARYGGDEFVLLAPSVDGERGAGRVMSKVRAALADPFDIGSQSIRIDASVGIAVYPNDADDAESLLQRADALMYSAKTTPGTFGAPQTGSLGSTRGTVRWMSCGAQYRGRA